MVVQTLGYNKVDYVKDGENRSFYKFYVADPAPSDKITFGIRCYEILTSTHYAETKILPAIKDDCFVKSLHIGWKDGKSFLYVR